MLDEIGDNSASDALVFEALARAENPVSRLDERASASSFSSGWRNRCDVRATLAGLYVDGALVHPEDLLLHDLGADVHAPDANVSRARRILLARRKANSGGAELLSWAGVAWLAGLTRGAPPLGVRASAQVDGVFKAKRGLEGVKAFFETAKKGDTESVRPGVEECLEILDIPGCPGLLQAAALKEAWRLIDPMPQHRWLGSLLAAIALRTNARFSVGLFPVEVAERKRRMPPRLAWAPIHERLAFWLELYQLAAELELEELTRLGHQKTQIERKAVSSRRSSRAMAFAQLAIDSPVLTTDSISRALSITPQGSLLLIRKMDGILQEVTGRSRFRVWRL